MRLILNTGPYVRQYPCPDCAMVYKGPKTLENHLRDNHDVVAEELTEVQVMELEAKRKAAHKRKLDASAPVMEGTLVAFKSIRSERASKHAFKSIRSERASKQRNKRAALREAQQ